MPGFLRYRTMFLILCAVALMGASAADVTSRIRGILLQGGGANFDTRTLDLPLLRGYYATRGYAPVWSGTPAAQDDARIALEALTEADADGLDPEHYHVAEIRMRLKAATAEATAQCDLLLSDGVFRFIRDLYEGRIELRELDRDVALPARAIDAPKVLDDALRNGRFAELLATLSPTHPAYGNLKRALARYRKVASDGGWPRIWDPVTDPLDTATPQTDLLRKRLSFEDARAAGPATDLKAAVEEFQRHHGLDADGRVGRRTLEALNVPASQRADEIAANMERWRWLPRDLGRRYIAVNAADATLAVVVDGRVVLNSKVIVGKPSNRTAIFSASVIGITFNPAWNIPAPIARKEILPKARRDPGYLGENHIVSDASGVLRQLPGEDNALGLLKLEMPNRFNAYLHDTPARTLFARSERHLSHGCIRVEQIRPLASFVLTGDAAQGLQEIQSDIAGGASKRISLDNPMPVFVLYWTAVASEDGSVDFFPDVYGRDQRLLAALAGKPVIGRVTMNSGFECRKA
ncbi:MAG TPA: L,D-transpeptidase family protein [Rhizomicrobium sp.]|nr:L,D-transpeptidase family protein [Rhizomicrobium sp.]